MKKTISEILVSKHKWDKETFVAKEDLLQDSKVKDSNIPDNIVRDTTIFDEQAKIKVDLLPNIPLDKVDGVSGNAQTIDYNNQRLTFAEAFNQLISDTNVSLLSNEDKTRLDTLLDSFESDTDNNVVDTIKEILELFSTYNGAVDIATALSGKVNTSDFNTYKQEVVNALSEKQDKITLSNKLSYNLLKDTPSIPSVDTVLDSANSTNAVSGSAVAKYVNDNYVSKEDESVAIDGNLSVEGKINGYGGMYLEGDLEVVGDISMEGDKIKNVGGIKFEDGTEMDTAPRGVGIQELTTQYIRIWDLNAGVYKWTYSGAKYLYYLGATAKNVISIPSSTGGEVILTVNKYSNSYKNWHIITSTTVYPTLYYGYTSSTSGTYNFKAVNSLITTKPRIKSVYARRTTATTTSFSTGLNVYFYNAEYQIKDGDIITITVFASPYASISTDTQAKHYTSLTFIKQDNSHGRLDLSHLMAETTVGNVSHTPSIDGAISIDCIYNEDEEDDDYSYWNFSVYGKNANCTPYYVEVTVWNSYDLDIE